MRDTHPLRLAFINSLILLVGFNGFYFIYNYFEKSIDWKELISYSALIFLVSYFIFLYTIENFLHKKIKLIYKTIHRFKTTRDVSKHNMFNPQDLLQDVDQEVSDWVEMNRKEIEDLRKLEIYRREFLGNVSHELKTPIFNIQGYVNTLLDGGLEDEAINRDYLVRTDKSVNRMIAIIQDLEAISKLESGELQMRYVNFDIIELTNDVIDFLSVKAFQEGVEIYIHKEYNESINVYADKENIRRVMINLIDNTINYCDKTKAKRKSKISFFDMDENILVEVADNGIGVAEASLPRLFERFFRTDKARSRSQGGTGLGLAIVKHIIEAHHQTINVRSTPGLGTTFAFTIRKAWD